MTATLDTELLDLCEQGQQALMATRYWEAEKLLSRAEELAWSAEDYDALSRLYMPLQETRRQRRQRCGEGVVALNLVAEGPADKVDPRHVVSNYPHGQLLVAGWGSIEPALQVRELAHQHNLYVETCLAAVYPMGAGKVVVIVPTPDVALPPVGNDDIDTLVRKLPPHSIVIPEGQLAPDVRRGTAQTFCEVMDLWESLHAPFLAAARQAPNPHARIAACRRTIAVDYACELAHQMLAQAAREVDRAK